MGFPRFPSLELSLFCPLSDCGEAGKSLFASMQQGYDSAKPQPPDAKKEAKQGTNEVEICGGGRPGPRCHSSKQRR